MPRYGERKGFGPGEDVSATEHERIRKDLAGLIADPRYRHDEAFKRHVRRQLQRIYNDPRNPKATLRIGVPKVFAKEVEPFDEYSAFRIGWQPSPGGRGQECAETA